MTTTLAKPASAPPSIESLDPRAVRLWNSCVLAWPFLDFGAGHAEDVGPRSLHGILGSDVSASDWIATELGPALKSTGQSNDKIYVPDPSADHLDGANDLSISLYFRPDVVGIAGTIYGLVGKYQPATGLRSWRLYMTGDEIALQVSSDGTAFEAQVTTNANLVAGTWYHLVVSFDTGVFRVWLDGVELSTDGDFSSETSIFAGGAEFRVGQRISSGGGGVETFQGAWADVRIWRSRALDDEAVADLFEDPWAMYRFREVLPVSIEDTGGGTAAGPWVLAGEALAGEESFVVPGLENDVSYDLRADTVDTTGNVTTGTTIVSATPQAAAAVPAAPRGILVSQAKPPAIYRELRRR